MLSHQNDHHPNHAPRTTTHSATPPPLPTYAPIAIHPSYAAHLTAHVVFPGVCPPALFCFSLSDSLSVASLRFLCGTYIDGQSGPRRLSFICIRTCTYTAPTASFHPKYRTTRTSDLKGWHVNYYHPSYSRIIVGISHVHIFCLLYSRPLHENKL